MNHHIQKHTQTENENQVVVSHHAKPKRNIAARLVTDRKKRPFMFVMLFALVGVAFIVRSFAASSEVAILRAFQNLDTQKPTAITGKTTVTYRDSRDIRSIAADYSVRLNQTGGSASASGKVTVNDKATFPYDIRYIDRSTYFRLGNTPALRSVIPKSSPAYSYFNPRFESLDAVNNRWLVKSPEQNVRPASGSVDTQYSCLVNTPLSISSQETQQLRKAFTKFNPLHVKRSSRTRLGGETVTRYSIIPSRKSNTDGFVDAVSSLNIVRGINSCAEKVAHAKASHKIKQGVQSSTVAIELYVDKNNIIKKIELDIRNKKSTTRLTADLGYAAPSTVSKPANATSATDFLGMMFHGTSAADTVKEKDLYQINAAIEQYIKRNNRLPVRLSELTIAGFKGPLSNYSYTYKSRNYNGGTTLTYSVCANFATQGSGMPYGGNTSNNKPELYTIHKPGNNCWENSYYKGGSHIRPPY